MTYFYEGEAVFNCENIKVWITHIGGYPGRYSRRVSDCLKSEKVDLFVCGHSHILKVINDKKHNLLHINPGAIGKHGFHIKRTMVRFDINGKKIENLEIIEYLSLIHISEPTRPY